MKIKVYDLHVMFASPDSLHLTAIAVAKRLGLVAGDEIAMTHTLSPHPSNNLIGYMFIEKHSHFTTIPNAAKNGPPIPIPHSVDLEVTVKFEPAGFDGTEIEDGWKALIDVLTQTFNKGKGRESYFDATKIGGTPRRGDSPGQGGAILSEIVYPEECNVGTVEQQISNRSRFWELTDLAVMLRHKPHWEQYDPVDGDAAALSAALFGPQS